MIKLEILKYEKCQPPPPFKKTFPCTILSPPFLIFQNPGLMGEVIPPLSQSTHLQLFLSLETLTFIIRTGIPILVELIDLVNSYNFSITNDLTQMVNFHTRIPDCDSYSPALLDLFISSDASICSTMAFPSLRNSDHVAVLVSIDFPLYSQQDALRDNPCEDIFKLSASAAASELCE